MGYYVTTFGPSEWFIFLLWVVAIIAPIVYSITNKTSLALSITLSVLLGSVVQVLWSVCFRYDIVSTWLWYDFVLIPNSCLLYTSPSPRDVEESRMPSSA